MQMKYRRSLGVVALVAGTAVLGGEQRMLAAQGIPFGFGPQMLAMGEGSHKYLPQGYLGVESRDVSEDQLGALKLKDARGAEITNLDHDGPACKAGMRMHDVILQMNGQVVENEDQLRRMLKDMPVGRSVSFVVSRDGQTQLLTMQMADRKTVGLQAW